MDEKPICCGSQIQAKTQSTSLLKITVLLHHRGVLYGEPFVIQTYKKVCVILMSLITSEFFL